MERDSDNIRDIAMSTQKIYFFSLTQEKKVQVFTRNDTIPFCKVFETKPQFVMVAEEFRIIGYFR